MSHETNQPDLALVRIVSLREAAHLCGISKDTDAKLVRRDRRALWGRKELALALHDVRPSEE
jgi:hypothetical protein